MKKLLLLTLIMGFGIAVAAQQTYQIKAETKQNTRIENPELGIEPIQSPNLTKSHIERAVVEPPADRNTNIVTVIDIGTAANPYGWGYAGGQQSLVNVNHALNSVTVVHRMGGELDPGGYSGDLGFDVSFDGGETFDVQLEFYVATENEGGEYYKDAARYTNHGVYNPTNSSDPNDAYIAYFCPVLEGTNDIWGGYTHGVVNLGDTSVKTKNLLWFHDDYYQGVPSGYFLSSQGLSMSIDQNYNLITSEYLGNLILTQGYWDDEGDFIYDQSQLEAEMTDDIGYPYDEKVAFSPDGQTGYICILGDNGEAEQLSGFFGVYPIFWKSTDAGETWEGPNYIQLGGPDGLGGIVNYHLTDQQIEELFEPPVPAREEISYTTAFDHDIAVDKNGNLHISVVVGPTGSDPYSIISSAGYMAAYDIFTNDGGTTFFAEKMGQIRTLRGTFGAITEDNRIRITTDEMGEKIFISWLDTDLEEEEDNNRPNIWCRGFEPATYMKTANASGEDMPDNVTNFSAGMWQAYFGTAANYCFMEDGKYIIPFVYEELSDPNDDIAPVQFKYIKDFFYTDASFTVQSIDEQIPDIKTASVSQNFPNPCNAETYVMVSMNESNNLNIEVYSLTGQMVYTWDYGYLHEGPHTITIDASQFTPGVYFYTVAAGEQKVTRKMIVE